MMLHRRTWLRAGVGAALACEGAFGAGAAQPHWRRSSPHHTAHSPHLARAATQPLVVIDPGHGGKDPGCIGAAGIMEKEVVLAIGPALRQQLLPSRRYRVTMTRSTDVFIPLEGRVRFAQQYRAAMLISLHANSAADARVRGASVYRFAITRRIPSRRRSSVSKTAQIASKSIRPAIARRLSYKSLPA